MKKLIISTVISILYSWTFQGPGIIGTWESISEKGDVLTGIFKADSTYEGYMNNSMFCRGMYSWKDRVFTFESDSMTGCSSTKGSYKVFFLADTLIRLDVIEDKCTPRNQGTNGVVFTRTKK